MNCRERNRPAEIDEDWTMRMLHDPDEYETVVESRACTRCNGDRNKCDGGCNGMFGIGQRRRSTEEVARIKAERRRADEDRILSEADAIRARRGSLDGIEK
jgi:hypothetical protein